MKLFKILACSMVIAICCTGCAFSSEPTMTTASGGDWYDMSPANDDVQYDDYDYSYLDEYVEPEYEVPDYEEMWLEERDEEFKNFLEEHNIEYYVEDDGTFWAYTTEAENNLIEEEFPDYILD